MPKRIDPGELASALPPGGLTLVSGCSAESAVLADAVMTAGAALGAMTFCGIFVGCLNRRTWLANDACRVLTFFLTPELRAVGERVEFLPLCYQDILRELRWRKPSAALFMCAPPDADGNCSFGTEVAFIADLWREIPVRIAHINPAMPRTPGDPGIPFAELTAYLEAEQPLSTMPAAPPDEVARAIASHVARFVRDGATIQTGLGKIPDAVLRTLTDRRGLRAQTGLMGDGLMALIEAGAIDGEGSAVVGVAIGSTELYAALSDPVFQFRPVSVTHGAGPTGGDRRSRHDQLRDRGRSVRSGLCRTHAQGPDVRPRRRIRFRARRARERRHADRRLTGECGQRMRQPDRRARHGGRPRLARAHGYRRRRDRTWRRRSPRARSYCAQPKPLAAIAPPDHRDRLRAEWSDYSRRL